jgi:hypothetical protein
MTVEISLNIMEARRKWHNIFQELKQKKPVNPQFCIQEKYP